MLRKPYATIGILCAFFVVAFVLATLTPVGFPYRAPGPNQAPKAQRIHVQHTLRQFFDTNETESAHRSDAGYLLQLFDRHNERTVREVLKSQPDYDASETPVQTNSMPECAKELFCGLPKFLLWSPQPESNRPNTPEMAQLSLASRESENSATSKLTFRLTGSFKTAVLVRPRANVTLVGWNLAPGKPPMVGLGEHYIQVDHGLPSNEPFMLELDLQTNGTLPALHVDPLVDISVATLFCEYHEHFTRRFAALVSSFPNWTAVVPCVRVVNIYSF